MWFILALAASVFAALTSILAKIGIDGVNSNLATAIRTAVVLVMSWGMSGLATGGSWLCYYKALQLGEASKVVPIDKLSVVFTMVLAAMILHEQFSPRAILGCILIALGTLLMIL